MKKILNKLKNKDFIISICLLMLLQAAIFWSIKLLQSNYHTFDTLIDQKIPLMKWTVYIYNMFYPLVFCLLAYLYTKDEKKYFNACIAGIIGYLMCDVVFLSYPTIMDYPRDIIVHNFTDLVLKITYVADTPALNCLPSIHCLFCFQTIYSLLSSKKADKRVKICGSIGLLLIAASTLTVKQHYFYDVIAALGVCIIANVIVEKLNLQDKIRKLQKKYHKKKKK